MPKRRAYTLSAAAREQRRAAGSSRPGRAWTSLRVSAETKRRVDLARGATPVESWIAGDPRLP